MDLESVVSYLSRMIYKSPVLSTVAEGSKHVHYRRISREQIFRRPHVSEVLRRGRSLFELYFEKF